MAESSYLRFNPETREIEIEGAEKFVKEYFNKIQQMFPKSHDKGIKGLGATTISSVKNPKAKKEATAAMPAPK